jgi:hypothetical protein
MTVLRHLLPLSTLAAALLLVAAAPAQAQAGGKAARGEDRGRSAERSTQQDRQDTLSDSIRRIERSTRGQVLSAERMQSDGRDVNRIKVVDDGGRVRIYLDDPRQGRRPPPTRDDDD